MQTAQAYMNDPRVLNDPGLMAAPEELRISVRPGSGFKMKQQD
jgi:hypothetical protein